MVEEYDKLFVISDLHLGGPFGQRAFREGKALQKLLLNVRDEAAMRTAFVINGDFIDFLAFGSQSMEFNLRPHALLSGLVVRTEDADETQDLDEVFTALGALLAGPRERHLVVQLGNHDIELAFASVQETLLTMLGATKEPARSRVHFETRGSGWLCKVGNRLVQVVHGNAWDPWNVVDHKGLEAAARAASSGSGGTPAPRTNAGTLMVCHVLNSIKAQFPFIDLLKPEDAPLMAVTAAVDAPTSLRGLVQAFRTRLTQGEYAELLGARQSSAGELSTSVERDVVEFLAAIPRPMGADALRRAEERLERNERVRDLVGDERGQLREMRSVVKARWQQILSAADSLRGKPELRSLREALQRWLREDKSFEVDRLSAIDLRIIDGALPGVDLLIAGHTHLPRWQGGAPEYINTGTWMRVLKLNGTQYLESDAAFQTLFDVIGKPHNLQQLDALKLDPRSRPVAVVDKSSARLCSVHEDGSIGHPLH